MSGTLRIVAEMPLIDVTTPREMRREYAGGVTSVDFSGPAPLIVSAGARQIELENLVRDVCEAWDEQVNRNEAIVAALRAAADRIEKGGDAADTLMPMLLSAVTQAAGGGR
jgi:hypothetical protein